MPFIFQRTFSMIFANFQCPGASGFSLLLAGLHVRCVHVIVFLERIGHIVATCFANVFIKCESRKPSRRSEFQIFSNFRVWGTRPASISWLWIIHRTIGSFSVIQPNTDLCRKSSLTRGQATEHPHRSKREENFIFTYPSAREENIIFTYRS